MPIAHVLKALKKPVKASSSRSIIMISSGLSVKSILLQNEKN